MPKKKSKPIPMKVFHLSMECYPVAKVGGLAPPAAARLHRVAPVLPITAILPPLPHEMKFDEVNPFVWYSYFPKFNSVPLPLPSVVVGITPSHFSTR